MGARTGYADGTFNWVDLAITQPKGRFSVLRDPQSARFLVFESSKLDP